VSPITPVDITIPRSSLDWSLDADSIKKRYKDLVDSRPSNVNALNHEVHQHSAQVVIPYAIDILKKAGYKLVTLAECLGQPAYQFTGAPAARDVSTPLLSLPVLYGSDMDVCDLGFMDLRRQGHQGLSCLAKPPYLPSFDDNALKVFTLSHLPRTMDSCTLLTHTRTPDFMTSYTH
jgi:hypothetical protein